jgi:hypothetical protein
MRSFAFTVFNNRLPCRHCFVRRLAELQKHGNEDWKKRTPVADFSPRDTGRLTSGRPISIADRLSHLSDAQANWQKKVEEKDAKQFTVDSKMGAAGERRLNCTVF